MKTTQLLALLLLCSVPLSTFAQKDPAPKPPAVGAVPEPPMPPKGKWHDERPREKVSFLGVTTSPVSSTLTEQLGLQKGIGLVVTGVVSDSPAAGVLKAHDILLKLNDQLLIETHQLAVLVRSFKEN